MDNLLSDFSSYVEIEPPDWDNEFYVSITRAAQLTGQTESQIRYLERFPIPLGKNEGTGGRNRVYTKRDIRLLKWISHHSDIKPSTIARFLETQKDAIFEKLGHVTLEQMLQREQSLAGRDMLISRLVTLLVSMLQDNATAQNVEIEGVIFGSPKQEWKTSSLQTLENKHTLDLANCLVVWSDRERSVLSNFKVFFSRQPWYLPFSEGRLFTTETFSERKESFTTIVFWRRSEATLEKQEQASFTKLDEPKRLLASMLMQSLKRVLDNDTSSSGEPISVYSRSVMGERAVLHGLSSLLMCCVEPYIPDCYAYVGKFGEDDQIDLLEDCGDSAAGYLPLCLASSGISKSNTRKIPWWVVFAREQASIALDKDVTRRPEKGEEHGSVVCIPLVGQAGVLGVLGIENTRSDTTNHCLAEKNGISSQALLRYLICIAEIAADYLELQTSLTEHVEKSRATYSRDETITWHLNVYRQGGLNYTETIEQIFNWTQQIHIRDKDLVDIVIIDIEKEDELAKKYKGFDIIIDILKKTKERIQSIIKDDPAAYTLASEKLLTFFEEPVADHLVFAMVNTQKDYQLVFLERIRRLWREESQNLFRWENEDLPVHLQVGICRFVGSSFNDKNTVIELMKHHLWLVSQQMFSGKPLEGVLEHDAVIPTIKI